MPAVEDVVKVGDSVTVKVIELDEMGRINLSMKQALPRPDGYVEPPKFERSGRSGGGFSGGRNNNHRRP